MTWASQVVKNPIVVKNPPANAGDTGNLCSVPEWERPRGEGNGNPLQYFCLGNSMGRGTWRATVHGLSKSQTRQNTHTHTHSQTHTGYFCLKD